MRIAESDDGTTKYALDPVTQTWNVVDESTYEAMKRQIDAEYAIRMRERSQRAASLTADEMNMPERLWARFGQGAYNLREGLKHAWHKYGGGDPEQARTIEMDQLQRQPYAKELRSRDPFLGGIAEGVPYIAGGAIAGTSGGAGLAGLGATALRQALMAGAIGGASYAPTLGARAGQAGTEAATAVLGEALGRGLGRMITPSLMPKTGAARSVIKEAEDIGFKVMPATLVESKRFRNVIEGGLETMPTSAPVLDEAMAENANLFNKYAAEAIGQKGAEEVSDIVLDNAHRQLGGVFEELAGKKRMFNMDETTLNQIGRLEAERISPYLSGLADPVRNIVDSALNLMTKRPRGEVTGRELHANITLLGNHARAVMRQNPEIGLALFDMQGILLDVLKRQLGKADAARFADARKKWKNLVNIESAVHPETGDIMPGILARRLKARDKPGYMQGQNREPFYTATRFMARAQPELRSSGTGERTALQNIMASALHLGPGATGAAATDPIAASLGFAAPFVLPYAAAKAYVAPGAKNWLLRQPFEVPLLPQAVRQPQNLLGMQIPGSTGPGFALTQQGLLGMGGVGLGQGWQGLSELSQ